MTALDNVDGAAWLRITDRIETGREDGCWIWLRAPSQYGYGKFRIDAKRTVYAHRLMYALLRAPIPHELEADHTCNVELCVNPYHIELVTRRVNLDRRNERNGWHSAEKYGTTNEIP